MDTGTGITIGSPYLESNRLADAINTTSFRCPRAHWRITANIGWCASHLNVFQLVLKGSVHFNFSPLSPGTFVGSRNRPENPIFKCSFVAVLERQQSLFTHVATFNQKLEQIVPHKAAISYPGSLPYLFIGEKEGFDRYSDVFLKGF